MLSKNARWSRLVLAGMLAVVLPSCSSSNNPTGNTDVPRAPVRTVVSQRSFSLNPLGVVFLDIQVTGSGTATLDSVVNWTFPANDVDIYVTPVTCNDANTVLLGGCTINAKADSATIKPERVSFSATAGNYRFWVINFGPGSESGTIEVGLTQ